jgi:hypothetical protein
MRQLPAWDATTLSIPPGRRAEALMLTHVAARAHDALTLESLVEGRVGFEPGPTARDG